MTWYTVVGPRADVVGIFRLYCNSGFPVDAILSIFKKDNWKIFLPILHHDHIPSPHQMEGMHSKECMWWAVDQGGALYLPVYISHDSDWHKSLFFLSGFLCVTAHSCLPTVCADFTKCCKMWPINLTMRWNQFKASWKMETKGVNSDRSLNAENLVFIITWHCLNLQPSYLQQLCKCLKLLVSFKYSNFDLLMLQTLDRSTALQSRLQEWCISIGSGGQKQAILVTREGQKSILSPPPPVLVLASSICLSLTLQSTHTLWSKCTPTVWKDHGMCSVRWSMQNIFCAHLGKW